MSIHARIDDSTDRRKGACACGWVQESESESCAAGHAAFVAHIEVVLGANAYYAAGVGCTNCGAEFTASIPVSIRVGSEHNRCQVCGTQATLVPRNDIADEFRKARNGGPT